MPVSSGHSPLDARKIPAIIRRMDFVALDVETANPDLASICQVGIAVFRNGQVVDEFSTLVDPQDYFDPMNTFVHGIEEADVVGSPTYGEICGKVNELLQGGICATHTAFDRSAIHRCCTRLATSPPDCQWLDTARVARRAWASVAAKGYGLANLAAMLNIEFDHHDALEDARTAGMVLCAAVQETGLSPVDWLQRVKLRLDGTPDGSKISMDGNPDGPLFGEALVFTGALTIPRAQAAQMAADLGCSVKPSVSKKITLLVVGDQDVTKLAGHQRSSKHRKALELIQQGCPIRILRESDFQALLDIT